VMHSTLLRNVKLYWQGDVVEGNVLIADGAVKAVSKREFTAETIVDGEGFLAIPGGIDLHAHIYDPEHTDHEDWASGSLAALYGGVTTLIDMPLRVSVDNLEVLKLKISEAARSSYVNYGVTGGFINERNYQCIRDLVEHGVITFKFFTCRPFTIRDEAIPRALKLIADHNAIAVFHAEDESLIDFREESQRARSDPVAYHESRSGYAEASAIMKACYYAAETGARVHIAHLSSKEGVEALRFLKQRGVRVTAEVTPHHLYFTKRDAEKLGNLVKVAPTLKGAEDREELWRGLSEGVIDTLASDNAPAPLDKKQGDVWSAWSGVPSLEVMIPLLYTLGFLQGRLSLKRLIEVVAENPAKILGVYPVKGSLSVGSHADIVVLDTRRSRVISARSHHHKVEWNPWEGVELRGVPYHVFVNGHVIVEKGELVGEPGKGIYIGDLFKRV
jgi:dihydroorotase (multifunctional complex type)